MRLGLKQAYRVVAAASFIMSVAVQSLAYPSSINVLTKEEIAKLSDGDLINNYIDVIVELEASRQFHSTSGFLPKEYDEFKNLFRYKILMKMELNKRELNIPDIED